MHEGGKTDCTRQLWVEERGTSGDIRDVFILCECGAAKSMAAAAARGTDVLGFCRGQRPWLGNDAWERCGGPEGKAQPNRLLLRNASDAYFSQVLRVISIPDADAALRLAVDQVYEDFLSGVASVDELRYERKKPKVSAALDGFDDAVGLRRDPAPAGQGRPAEADDQAGRDRDADGRGRRDRLGRAGRGRVLRAQDGPARRRGRRSSTRSTAWFSSTACAR